MVLIYTTRITNRIQYIFNYVFNEKFGLEYRITDKKNEYAFADQVFKIFYDNGDIGEGIYLHATGFLLQDDIKRIELHAGIYDNIQTLFSHGKNAALNFDVFSAVFYLLSRYEEYFDDPKTAHGNYDFHHSILYKLDILHTPVVEQWLNLLKDVLLKNFPSLALKQIKPRVALSFDIDVAYAYKNRSIARTIGGLAKKINRLNFNEAKNHLLTLLNKRKDMFDTYDYIFSSIKNKKPIVFFNMGLYGKFDKNPSWKNKKFQRLIRNISEKAVIGLHPSYASNKNKFLITSEKNKLENISGKTIKSSRQHYLKLKFPSTYNNLIANNITEDYTLGYSRNYGFRAGTCSSFLYFNLLKNETTCLRLFPFAYMDVTLNNNLKLSTGEAKGIIKKLIDTVYKYNGTFIPLWHNSTLCDCNEWQGWREVFEYMIIEIENKNFENLFI